MNKMYHVFSEGENVLFREDSDYIFFNNKFASSSYAYRLQPLAESTMSTHFHSLSETVDESAIYGFIEKLHKAYSIYYAGKYGYSIGKIFKIDVVEVCDREHALKELLYVMKNPVHHYVSHFSLQYRYSSASYVFMDKLLQPDFLEAVNAKTVSFGSLTVRRRKELLNADTVPDNWRVNENGMILPSSYINNPKVRAFWNGNVKSFLVDINKNQTDAKKEIIDLDVLELRTSGLTDIEVCRIIDDFCMQCVRKSIHFLSQEEKRTIIQILRQKRIPDQQIKRCMWVIF